MARRLPLLLAISAVACQPDWASLSSACAPRGPATCAERPGVALCDSFEEPQPDPRWHEVVEPGGRLAIEDACSLQGERSLHAHTDPIAAGTGGRADMDAVVPLPHYFVRLHAYLRGPVSPEAEVKLAQVGVAGYDWTYGLTLKVGEGVYKVQNGITRRSSESVAPATLDSWVCLELEVVPADAGTIRLWEGSTRVIEASDDTVPSLPLDMVRIGLVGTTPAVDRPTTDVWFDELVVDDERIGCDP